MGKNIVVKKDLQNSVTAYSLVSDVSSFKNLLRQGLSEIYSNPERFVHHSERSMRNCAAIRFSVVVLSIPPSIVKYTKGGKVGIRSGATNDLFIQEVIPADAFAFESIASEKVEEMLNV